MNDPIIRRIHACVLAHVPVILWGEPGTGKTARVTHYGHARNLHTERWLLSRCEPIDLKPRIYDGGKVVVGRPPELDSLAEGGILFVDELNRTPREVEGAALDIVDNPPPNVGVIAACNPPSRGQAARPLESAAANRFCHLHVTVDAAAWANAAIGGWPNGETHYPIPDERAMAHAARKANALVSAYIRRNAGMLEKPPTDPINAGKAWPSTRTWDYARRLHAVAIALSLDAEDTMALIGGVVGDGAAVEYSAFVVDADLPDPEDLMRDPSGYSPERGRVDRVIAALTAVAGAVESNCDNARWKAAWAVVSRCVEVDHTDAAMVGSDLLVAFYKRLAKRDGKAYKALSEPYTLMHKRVAAILVK